MLSEIDAKKIAREHVASQPRPAPGYAYTLGRMVVVEPGWYFDYEIDCKLANPEQDREPFSGALGFVVDRETGDISLVSHTEWVDLGLAFCDKPYGDSDLTD